MAYRGRGRGRGGWRGGFSGYFKPEPFELFPDVELPDVKSITEERTLVGCNAMLLKFWKDSPYYLEEHVSKKSQSMDIERYSDWEKLKTSAERDALYQNLQLQSHNFPKELIGDARKAHRSAKKMRLNLDAGLQKLDVLEKFEKGEEKEGNEKKDGEEEENTDDEEGELSDQSYSDDGDYNENEYFDDDEDDYNVDDDNDDEPTY